MTHSTERILAGLKDFQRDTVEYAFRRLWTDQDAVKRFLVADEVGLGKTMVAKGLIAKTVDHLWDEVDRIDVVYICSNHQIATQNLRKLNAVGGAQVKHADRLTLLPRAIRNLRDQRVNFVSFTPGTSFNVGSSGGAYPERVLLYWMLASGWPEVTSTVRWLNFFEGGMARHNFRARVKDFDPSALDEELCATFVTRVDAAIGPQGGSLRDELLDCVAQFTTKRPRGDLGWRRSVLIGRLRQLVANAAVQHLEPDLVILDEFQRFKNLLDSDDEGARLANEVFDHPDARVLLLSATPYKMYTLPDEPEGDDHYQDFMRTFRFLADDARAAGVEQDLRLMREALSMGGDLQRARDAHDRVQHQLQAVMCRTERLAASPDRDGMLAQREAKGLALSAQDVRSWLALDEVARHVGSHDAFEYWRSSPYPLNLMDRNSYQIRTRFQAAMDRDDGDLAKILEDAPGLLKWEDIRAYRRVDGGNAKMRWLCSDVVDSGAWRLLWLPPCLPYYELEGAYAQPAARAFTKRLVFSAWTVVPKAISVVASYEAERLAVRAARSRRGYDGRPVSPPLQFRLSGKSAGGMTTLALMYPCVALARVGDPLEVARRLGGPGTQAEVRAEVRARAVDLLEGLSSSQGAAVDPRWYWAAPLLLDSDLEACSALYAPDHGDVDSRLDIHLVAADEVGDLDLGSMPDDLPDVLASLALGGPGVCALRAIARAAGGSEVLENPLVRKKAVELAQALRSLFNKPEVVTLLRAGRPEVYWRAVLDENVDGCLQAVLDEYVHMLVESEGLQEMEPLSRIEPLVQTMVEAITVRTASNLVEDIEVQDGTVRSEEHRVNSHFAARYGRAESSDKAAIRETTMRVAFNSPFRPFVLASTSVGQEGLDFHTYCHAVVHWNLPSNPVDLEQREGRVHRYKGHAIRKNVADAFGAAAFTAEGVDPWADVFARAEAVQPEGTSEIRPFWVFTTQGGAVIERYVPALPLSREVAQFQRLQRTLGAYRLLLGQPRQEDLVRYVGEDAQWLQLDLAPPRG